VRLLGGIKVTDTLCGTKAFFREDYGRMIWGRCPWGDFDILFNAARLRLTLKEIPITYHARRYGESKMRAVRVGFQYLATCFGWWLYLMREKTRKVFRKKR